MPRESSYPLVAQAAPSRVMAATAFAAFALLAAGGARAAGGWTQDYEYPGRGVGWYGATARYELRRDFPIPVLEQATDGDDYSHGYDALFDRYGFGPPAQSTDVSRHEYIFRFGSDPIIPYGCSFDAQCTDYVFCNGTEHCVHGACVAEAAPNCDDGEACTDNACDELSSRCITTVLTAAHEVASLMLARAPGSPVASLSWQPLAEASSYNVYRCIGAPQTDFACIQSGLPVPSLDDDGLVLLPGRPLNYLVTAVGCGAEGSAGTDSRDRERRLTQPCP